MIHILSDSSALYSCQDAKEAGFTSIPLNVIVDNHSYKDVEQITASEFVNYCKKHAQVSTSQPSIGEKLAIYDEILQDPEAEILDITMCDGLSGTYQSSCMAKENCSDPSRVTVLDSHTLCGPQRGMVQKAVALKEEGKSVQEIVEELEKAADTEVSTVVAEDIDFLVRGGRVSNLVGKVGSFLRLLPVTVKEGNSLKMQTACRTYKKVFDSVDSVFQKHGVNDDYTIYICHGENEGTALKAKDYFGKKYPNAKIEVHELCPMFICHGGPGCVSFQAINLKENA